MRYCVLFFLLIAGGFSAPAFSFSATETFLKNLKTESIERCSKEDAPLPCLVASGELASYFRDNVDDTYFSDSLRSCVAYHTESKSEFQATAIIECAFNQSQLRKHHPHPEYRGIIFELSSFRSEWLADCLKTAESGASSCMRRREFDFNRYWSFYIYGDLEGLSPSKMRECLGLLSNNPDFSITNMCLGIE